MRRICRRQKSATAGVRRRLFRQGITAALCLAALAGLGSAAGAQKGVHSLDATVGLSGTGPDNTPAVIPGVSTWRTLVSIKGVGFQVGAVDVYLRGPLNTLGVASTLRGPLKNVDDANGAFKTDANGNFRGTIQIPYQNRANQGALPFDPDITRPGLYQIYAEPRGGGSLFALSSRPFNVCPNTLNSIPPEPLWPRNRGARDGFLEENSPERTDPEYTTVWSEQPVAIYATVAPSTLDGTRTDGPNQGSHISARDYPWTHSAHDWNLHLIPDFPYLWVMGLANFQGEASSNDTGRIEWEWETQNNGSPASYGRGTIGVPLFATPTVGDRIYTVGRWILDNGHPDEGIRTEIHPPRMIATMRKRHTAVPFAGTDFVTRASQVDIFVSGHGGGINRSTYAELERFLGNKGKGGARLKDVGIGTTTDPTGNDLGLVYHGPGPDAVVHETFREFVSGIAGLLSKIGIGPGPFPSVFNSAGPSAMFTDRNTGLPALSGVGWGKRGESRPINDMDYEFDVPLPARPQGATTPQVQVTTRSVHKTAVSEVITYIAPDSAGFPTAAHIRLPYKGGDNGIYARTLHFYWDAYSAPGNHFVVQLNDILTTRALGLGGPILLGGPQPLYLWADVCGQWTFLSDLNPDGLLKVKKGISTDPDRASFANLPGARFDVYLDPTDTLRLFIGGYAQRDMDHLLGKQFALNAYDAGIEALKTIVFGTGDNRDVGGAVFDAPIAPADQGLHTVNNLRPPDPVTGEERKNAPVDTTISPTGAVCPQPLLTASFNLTHVPSAPHISSPGATFGAVCSSATKTAVITNSGQSPLVITRFAITGTPDDFSLVPSPSVPVTVPGGGLIKVQVRFAAATLGAKTATLDIFSNDPGNPVIHAPLTGTRHTPSITATADTGRTPSLVVGATTTWPVTITNNARSGCSLNVKPSISGFGGVWSISLRDRNFGIPPGGTSTDLIVKFTSNVVTRKAVGTLTITSNDVAHPTTTLVFGAEGVPVGMRVLVVGADGTPYPVVDSIELKSRTGKGNAQIKEVSLTTIDPPASWKRIQYHYMTALDPAAGRAPYEVQVQVGNKKRTIGFNLRGGEFKELTITLP